MGGIVKEGIRDWPVMFCDLEASYFLGFGILVGCCLLLDYSSSFRSELGRTDWSLPI